LLLKYREQVSALVDVETCLDLLARGADADSRSYSEHMERFRGNLRAFFPPPPASPTHGERRQGRGPIRWIRSLLQRILETLGLSSGVASKSRILRTRGGRSPRTAVNCGSAQVASGRIHRPWLPRSPRRTRRSPTTWKRSAPSWARC